MPMILDLGLFLCIGAIINEFAHTTAPLYFHSASSVSKISGPLPGRNEVALHYLPLSLAYRDRKGVII